MVGFTGLTEVTNIAQRLIYAIDNEVTLLDKNKFQPGEISTAMVATLVDIDHYLDSASSNDVFTSSVRYFLEFSGIVSLKLSHGEILESIIDLLLHNNLPDLLKSTIRAIDNTKEIRAEALLLFVLKFNCQLATLSPTVKLALHSDETMRKILSATNMTIPSVHIATVLEDLFLSLCELGLKQNELQTIYKRSRENREEVSLFQKMLSLYPIQHKSLLLEPGSQATFDKLKLHDTRNGFTIQTWIKLNSVPVNHFKKSPLGSSILSLSDDDNIPIIDYRAVGNFLALCVVDPETGSTKTHTFEEFELQPTKLHHVVMVHKPDSLMTSYKIDLFIDGVYIDSYNTSFSIIKKKGGQGFASAKKSKVLSLTLQNSSTSYNLVEVVNVLMVNSCLKLEWILVSLNLGPLYAGNFQDKSIYDFLSYDSKLKINLKLQEANDLYGKEFLVKDIENFSLESMNDLPSVNLDIATICLNFHSLEVQLDDKSLILYNELTSPGYRRVIIPQESIHYWNPRLIESSVNSLGGFSLFFSLIEVSKTTEAMLSPLRLLFTMLSSNNEFLVEFESKNGYDILGTLLKTKVDLINIDVLDSVLNFVGYDFQCPSNSILKNILAYKSLISDFEIWNSDTKDDSISNPRFNETFKFLIFQFTVFGQDSRYHSFNAKRLMKMRIIKRIIQALKSGCFDKDVLPVLHDSLLILLRSNPTSDNLRSLSLYVLYALNCKEGDATLQIESGVTVLDVLSTIVSESLSPNNPSQKRILKCINIRWILLLFQDPNIEVIKVALKMLFQTLKAMDAKHYRQFMDPMGMTILSSFLKVHWRVDEIKMLVFGAIFGIVYSSEMGQDLHAFSNNIFLSSSPYQLVMPEFFFIFNNMISEALDALSNKNLTENDQEYLDGISLLNSYVLILKVGTQAVPSLYAVSHENIRWLSEGLGILLKVSYIRRKRDEEHIDSIFSKMKSFYADIFIEKVFTIQKQKRYSLLFIEEISAHSRTTAIAICLVVIPSILEHYKLHSDSLPRTLFDQSLDITVGKLALQYLSSEKHVLWSVEDYKSAIALCGFLLDRDDRGEIFSKNPVLRTTLCKLFSEVFLSFLARSLSSERSSDREKDLEICYSGFIIYQKILLSSGFNDKDLTFLICAFCKNSLQKEDDSLSLNALRMCFMQIEKRYKKVSNCLTSHLSVQESFTKFAFDSLSMNDEELKEKLSKVNPFTDALKKYFNVNVNAYTIKESAISLSDLVKRPLGHNRNIDESIKKVLNNEMIPLTKAVILYEQKRFDRHNQDSADDLHFYISMYHSIRASSPMETFKVDWLLDSTEGPERTRSKIFPERVTDTIESQTTKKGLATESDGANNDAVVSQLTDSIDDEVAHEDKNRKVLRSLYVGDRISKMFNVTKILGLSTVETLLIVGVTHLYLIEHYFHNKDGDIIDIDDAPKESRDQYMQLIVDKPKDAPKKNKEHRLRTWEITNLVSVSKRQFLLREVAIELFFLDGSNVLITCLNRELRDKLVSVLSSKITAKHPEEDIFTALHFSSTPNSSSNSTFTSKLANAFGGGPSQKPSFSATKKWCKGEFSNFYYLMLINTLAGRTFNDLTQYPVFPWVIADYTSEELDLNDPKTFRDLSKPMGAQTEARASQFRERYEASEGIGAPPFHYGTHYSSSMIIAGYLIRLEPFINSYLLLQGGKLDHADRLFTSIAKAWTSSSRDNTADVRELTPEFFYLPEFLQNRNNFNLGKMQDGTKVDDVELPPWAKGDPKIFIQKNREALESEYVSKHLHQWIDLIFGFKQQGSKAVENLNVFNHLSYHGAIDLDAIKDEHERHVMTSIIHNFGQTPLQIFSKPHPAKSNFEIIDLDSGDMFDLPLSIIEADRKVPIERIDIDPITLDWKGRTDLEAADDKLTLSFNKETGTYRVNDSIFESFNVTKVTSVELLGNSCFVTGCSNGIIHVLKYLASKSVPGSNLTNARNVDSTISDAGVLSNIERKGILRGHFSEIKDIKVSKAFKILVSVDTDGIVILWDSIKLMKLREIARDVNFISVSNETGNIVTVGKDDTVEVFTLNGDSVVKKRIEDQDYPQNRIACIGIGELEWCYNSSRTTHEYWRHSLMIAIGWSQRSTVSLHEVQLRNGWQLQELRFFRSLVVSPAKITAIRLKFEIELNYEGKKVAKAELIAGDNVGRMMIWR